MSSPFLRNRQRKLAALAAPAPAETGPKAPASDSAAGQEYAALRVRLHDNRRELKDIESHEARIPKKAEFAKHYVEWISGVIEAGQPVQDEILLINMIWAFDYGDYAFALKLAEFAITHGLKMPEAFTRSPACFLRESIAEAALADETQIDHAILIKVDQLTADADMPDQAKAKLNKALGRSWAAKAAAFDPSDENAPAGGAASFAEQGLQQLRRALKLDDKAGVKKDIEKLERQLRDLAKKDD